VAGGFYGGGGLDPSKFHLGAIGRACAIEKINWTGIIFVIIFSQSQIRDT
jgi:hypothetical protein